MLIRNLVLVIAQPSKLKYLIGLFVIATFRFVPQNVLVTSGAFVPFVMFLAGILACYDWMTYFSKLKGGSDFYDQNLFNAKGNIPFLLIAIVLALGCWLHFGFDEHTNVYLKGIWVISAILGITILPEFLDRVFNHPTTNHLKPENE